MFNIIVITPEIDHPQEFDVIQTLISTYNCTIHLRKPSFSEFEYKQYLQRHNHQLAHFVLHEHHSLAKEFHVKGVHLKESNRISVIKTDNNVTVISTALHNIRDAGNLTEPFNYFFYSPLFQSISKENYGTNNSSASLKKIVAELKEKTSIPIIGLGGINEETIVLVKSSGFDGAAVLGAIWQCKDPVVAFERIHASAENTK